MMPATQSGLWPAYSMPYYRFKREADLPFEVRSKMTGPLSRQEYKVQVDRMGNGQSYQHVERQMAAPLASRRYSNLRDQMEDNRQRLRDQQRMDMDRQRIMDREQQRMDLERERMMSNMDRQRNMDM